MTVKDVAKYLRVCPNTVYRLMERREFAMAPLPCREASGRGVCRNYRILRSTLDDWINKRMLDNIKEGQS